MNESAKWAVTINVEACSNDVQLTQGMMHVFKEMGSYESEGPLKGGISGSIQKLGPSLKTIRCP